MTGIASIRVSAHVRKLSARVREENDFYRTPVKSTRALLAVEAFPTTVWEPACGDGAISNVLSNAGYQVVSSDLFDRGFGETGIDFLKITERRADAVVMNPPFTYGDEFVLHALDLGVTKIAVFMRMAWLEGAARHERLWKPHPPVRIWAFSRRQTLWRGDDTNPKNTGGAIAFAWYVFEAGNKEAPRMGWLPW